MKTILITGASRGIGLATAKKFLEEGWLVIGTYSKTPIPLHDKNLLAIHCDQAKHEDIMLLVREVKARLSHIDVLVNNAGIINDNQDDVVDVVRVRKTFDVDLFGVIDTTEQLLPMMGEGSHIVNIDSSYGSFSLPIDDATSTGYRLAKAALNMYTRTLAFRLKPQGIIVSSLDPGWVKTDMGNAVSDETVGPDRTPEQPASEIFALVTSIAMTVDESGNFWLYGKKREW